MEKEKTLIHHFDINSICDYFGRLEQQGHGSPESTIRTLSFIDNTSIELIIADLGCGTGGQTMTLIQNTKGMIRNVYEVEPIVCPQYGGTMKVIAFLTDYAVVDRIISPQADFRRREALLLIISPLRKS